MKVPSDALLSRYAPLTPVKGCPALRAHQAPDVFSLWRAWEEESGCQTEVPYWATVWPAAQALARYILDHPALAAGRRVLDLGCGGGVSAIACAAAGAGRVTANDIDPAALHVARLNAAAGGATIETHAGDMLDQQEPVGADLIVVADLFYNKEQSERAVRFLRANRGAGARIIIADAGRPFVPSSGVRTLWSVRESLDRDLEGRGECEVRILDFRG